MEDTTDTTRQNYSIEADAIWAAPAVQPTLAEREADLKREYLVNLQQAKRDHNHTLRCDDLAAYPKGQRRASTSRRRCVDCKRWVRVNKRTAIRAYNHEIQCRCCADLTRVANSAFADAVSTLRQQARVAQAAS